METEYKCVYIIDSCERVDSITSGIRTVVFPPGVYGIKTTAAKQGLTIQSDTLLLGYGATIKLLTNADGLGVIFKNTGFGAIGASQLPSVWPPTLSSDDNITIEGFTFESISVNGRIILLANVDNVRVRRCRTDSLAIGFASIEGAVSDIAFEENSIRCAFAIQIRSSGMATAAEDTVGVRLVNNFFEKLAGNSIPGSEIISVDGFKGRVRDVSIANNTFICSSGSCVAILDDIEIAGSETFRIVVADNTMIGSTDSGSRSHGVFVQQTDVVGVLREIVIIGNSINVTDYGVRVLSSVTTPTIRPEVLVKGNAITGGDAASTDSAAIGVDRAADVFAEGNIVRAYAAPFKGAIRLEFGAAHNNWVQDCTDSSGIFVADRGAVGNFVINCPTGIKQEQGNRKITDNLIVDCDTGIDLR